MAHYSEYATNATAYAQAVSALPAPPDTDEDNPRGLAVYHAADLGPHDCKPRVRAECWRCGTERVLCLPCPAKPTGTNRLADCCQAELDAIMGRVWCCRPEDCGRQVP